MPKKLATLFSNAFLERLRHWIGVHHSHFFDFLKTSQ